MANSGIIDVRFDKTDVWNRVKGRSSVFLDSMVWNGMADSSNEAAVRVKKTLLRLVAEGRVFCPTSYGTLEELWNRKGDSLDRRAGLMEDLSLNSNLVMRDELYAWELSRSIAKFNGTLDSTSREGLYVVPSGYVGSHARIHLQDVTLSPAVRQSAEDFMTKSVSDIGIRELTKRRNGLVYDDKPAAYQMAAQDVAERYKGNRKKLFYAEALNCFRICILKKILAQMDSDQSNTLNWLVQFKADGNENVFIDKLLPEFPALHNYVDLMVQADLQPTRNDKTSDFLDNDIIVAPLAYADAFVSFDKNIRHLLRNQTEILLRTKCVYLDSWEAFEGWLAMLQTGG